MWKINITGKGAEGNRIKTFGLYALSVILFFIFSNIMIEIALKTSYEPMDTYKTIPSGITVNITEAKATYVNGYVGGTITNSNPTVLNTYMKIDLYTKRNVCMGTKYVQVNHLKQDETRDFRMGFKFNDIDYVTISFVDEISEEVPKEAFESDNLSGAMLITTVIFLCFFG